MASSRINRKAGRNINGRRSKSYTSTAHYMLSSLIPYTEANLNLAFHPNKFFNDLDKLSGRKYKTGTLKVNYYRAIKQGLVQVDGDGIPRLTEKGNRQLRRYEPRKLKGEASVLVIFDIPEEERALRDRLRITLRELRFVQIQQSVWRSEYDVVDHLVDDLEASGLREYVQIHESIRIK